MKKYLIRKLGVYMLTFMVAITLNWLIPRLMPGDPIISMVSKFARKAENAKRVYEDLTKRFEFDKPMVQQYFIYLKNLAAGNLGQSLINYPVKVIDRIKATMPFTLIVTLPALILSFLIGNRLGAAAARNKKLDDRILPFWYVLSSTPYLWLGILLVYFLATGLRIFPQSKAFGGLIPPKVYSFRFILDYIHHWVLPFLSLFIVQLGGWAVGMRNMIIYELEADYSRYLKTLGASDKLIRRYAYKNAQLPQISGLPVQLGMLVGGAITTEMVFAYPGIGLELGTAIMRQDYFLVQGCFLIIVLIVLVGNFLLDILYAVLDPRVRLSMIGD